MFSNAYTFNQNMFQFHSGLIKSSISLAILAISLAFQFHSGLIKSNMYYSNITRMMKFQFHSGLIKRMCQHFYEWPLINRFNSILVWLKGQLCDGWWGFRNLFQFHSGLIKRCPLLCHPPPNISSFNSILVWLKVNRPCIRPYGAIAVSIPFWSD